MQRISTKQEAQLREMLLCTNLVQPLVITEGVRKALLFCEDLAMHLHECEVPRRGRHAFPSSQAMREDLPILSAPASITISSAIEKLRW